MKRSHHANHAELCPEEIEIGLEVARVGLGTLDYVRDTIRLDTRAAGIFGLDDTVDIPRETFRDRIHPEDRPGIDRQVDALLDPAQPDVIDMTYRILLDDGTLRWVNARKKVLFENRKRGARPVSGVFAVVDVTKRQRAEIRSEMLIRELKHRSKNLITVVSGIARQLQRHNRPEDFATELTRRLDAMARNQDAVVDDVQGSYDLHTVLRRQIKPFLPGESRVSLDGPPLDLRSDAGQVIGMVAHELATNAVKYGAWSNPAGRVRISWTRSCAEEELRLEWQESGGPPVTPPTSQGFGDQVLRTLTRVSLDAETTLDFAESGLVARFRFPLSELLDAGNASAA